MSSDIEPSDRRPPQKRREITVKPSSFRYYFPEFGSPKVVHEHGWKPDSYRSGERDLPIGHGFVMSIPREKICGAYPSMDREMLMLKVDPFVNEVLMQNRALYQNAVRSHDDDDIVKIIFGQGFNPPSKGRLPEVTPLVPLSGSTDITEIVYSGYEQTFPDIWTGDGLPPLNRVDSWSKEDSQFKVQVPPMEPEIVEKVVAEFTEYIGFSHKFLEVDVDCYNWNIYSDLVRVGVYKAMCEKPNASLVGLEVFRSKGECSVVMYLPKFGYIEWNGMDRDKGLWIDRPAYAMTKNKLTETLRAFLTLYKIATSGNELAKGIDTPRLGDGQDEQGFHDGLFFSFLRSVAAKSRNYQPAFA